jgi:hypothetical protein
MVCIGLLGALLMGVGVSPAGAVSISMSELTDGDGVDDSLTVGGITFADFTCVDGGSGACASVTVSDVTDAQGYPGLAFNGGSGPFRITYSATVIDGPPISDIHFTLDGSLPAATLDRISQRINEIYDTQGIVVSGRGRQIGVTTQTFYQTVVPEPGSVLALGIAALAGVLGFARRRGPTS